VAEDTMAEDTVPTCKRGHPRIPENKRKGGGCAECHRFTNRRYQASEAGRRRTERFKRSDAGRAAMRRYNDSTSAWEAQRRYKLKGEREAIQDKLDALEREEKECRRTLSAPPTRTR